MKVDQKRLTIKKVRLSYPRLFTPGKFEGNEASVAKYSATFLLPKKGNQDVKKLLDSEIAKLEQESKIKVKSDKLFITDGDESEKDEQVGHWVIRASNKKRPQLFDKDGTALDSSDEDKLLPGYWVDAVISLWAQNNKYGKRINANILGVRFVKEDEVFGGGNVDVSEDFDFDFNDSEEL